MGNAARLPGVSLTFFDGHSSPVPERSAIIENAAWHEAVQQLADALVQAAELDALFATTQLTAQTLPNVVDLNLFDQFSVSQPLPLQASVLSALRQSSPLLPFFVPNPWSSSDETLKRSSKL